MSILHHNNQEFGNFEVHHVTFAIENFSNVYIFLKIGGHKSIQSNSKGQFLCFYSAQSVEMEYVV